jgi:hypothetical protein
MSAAGAHTHRADSRLSARGISHLKLLPEHVLDPTQLDQYSTILQRVWTSRWIQDVREDHAGQHCRTTMQSLSAHGAYYALSMIRLQKRVCYVSLLLQRLPLRNSLVDFCHLLYSFRPC